VMNANVKEDFEGLEEADESPDAVIMGDLGEAFGFEILNRAFRMVMDGAELIALQKNRFWLAPDGLALNAGPFVAAIEYATDREAVVVGKPSPSFFALVLEDVGARAEDAAIVGDDVETDVDGGMRAGLAGVLVRTGKYREDFVHASGVAPTATVDSIAAVPDLVAG
jgi:HAD superfamily hydrolase (TIGR01458 family)